MISRAAKGQQGQPGQPRLDWDVFFREEAGGHFGGRPFLRPPSMSDSAGNCTVMIVDPVRCQGRQKTGVSETFLSLHIHPYYYVADGEYPIYWVVRALQ